MAGVTTNWNEQGERAQRGGLPLMVGRREESGGVFISWAAVGVISAVLAGAMALSNMTLKASVSELQLQITQYFAAKADLEKTDKRVDTVGDELSRLRERVQALELQKQK